MLSMYCTASMLPCGRYYYAPEGGYVGNPWVKFSYQYIYLYMAWIIHHLDILEQYCFQYSRHIIIRCNNVNKIIKWNKKHNKGVSNKTTRVVSRSDYRLGMAWNSSIRYINR